jgi:hypothetical protein
MAVRVCRSVRRQGKGHGGRKASAAAACPAASRSWSIDHVVAVRNDENRATDQARRSLALLIVRYLNAPSPRMRDTAAHAAEVHAAASDEEEGA